MLVPSSLRQLRHPSYTGVHRSVAFTAVNVLVAVLLAYGVSVAWPDVGAIVFLTAVAVIVVRGYLLPGTPRLHDAVRRLRSPTDDLPVDDEFDPVVFLGDVGALSPGLQDLELDRRFVAAWRERILDVGGRETDGDTLADTLDVEPSSISLRWQGATLVARHREQPVGRWPSRAAFVADVTAVAELETRTSRWWTLRSNQRGQALRLLRLCLDTCPVCDGHVVVGSDPVERAQGTEANRITATCTGCNARLFESTHDATPLPARTSAGGSPPILGPDDTE